MIPPQCYVVRNKNDDKQVKFASTHIKDCHEYINNQYSIGDEEAPNYIITINELQYKEFIVKHNLFMN